MDDFKKLYNEENKPKIRTLTDCPEQNFNKMALISNVPEEIMENYSNLLRETTDGVVFQDKSNFSPSQPYRFTQEYNNFNDLDMSKSQISHNYVKRIIDSATKFNQKLKELGERRQIQIPDDEDEINFMVEAIPSSLSELYTYKSTINNNNKQNSNNQFVEIFKK